MSNLSRRITVSGVMAIVVIYLAVHVFTASSYKPQHNNNDQHHTNSGFTDNVGTWPPQPISINNINLKPINPISRAVEEAQKNMIHLAINNTDAQQQLGDTYIYGGITNSDVKWQETANSYQVEFFSYSNNQTVRITIENNLVADVTTRAASEYQPPVRQAESEEAISIARDFWVSQEQTRINELEGFAILAHPSSATESLYNSRVVYVSFHASSTASPELFAWVDMNTRAVIKSFAEVEQQ